MIKEVGEELLEEVVKLAWEISQNENKNSFPKHESYDDMYNAFLKAIHHNKDKVLVCYEDGEMVGVLNLFVETKNRYLQGNGGIFAKGEFNFVATQFIDYLRKNYEGNEMFFGYPAENVDAISFLTEINAELAESSLTMELKKQNFIQSLVSNDVVLLEKDYYEEYAVFHDKYNPDIYWTSERIFENLNIWKIYIVVKNQKIAGSILIRMVDDKLADIYCVTIDSNYNSCGLELDLLSRSLYDIFKEGKERVLHFVDEGADDELQAALKTGFKQIDSYRGYRLKL
ncbi:MAG: hypothetical protein WDA24_00625 [Tissierellales bacterium]